MEITKELKDKALKTLCEKYGRNAYGIFHMVNNSYPEDLRDAFYSYIETGNVPEYEYDGKSFEYVMEKTYSDVLDTFLQFDRLIKNEDLSKNFDNINFGKK